jgi:Flp pilus assembly protein TadG
VNERSERGGILPLVAVFLVALVAMVGLVYDGGRVIDARRRAADQAEQAARAGAAMLDPGSLRGDGPYRLDARAALAAARAQLAATGSTGAVTVSGNVVQVTVTFSQPTALLGLIGIGSVGGSGTADARSVKGVSTEDPDSP